MLKAIAILAVGATLIGLGACASKPVSAPTQPTTSVTYGK